MLSGQRDDAFVLDGYTVHQWRSVSDGILDVAECSGYRMARGIGVRLTRPDVGRCSRLIDRPAASPFRRICDAGLAGTIGGTDIGRTLPYHTGTLRQHDGEQHESHSDPSRLRCASQLFSSVTRACAM
jgi:hypothetical protein